MRSLELDVLFRGGDKRLRKPGMEGRLAVLKKGSPSIEYTRYNRCDAAIVGKPRGADTGEVPYPIIMSEQRSLRLLLNYYEGQRGAREVVCATQGVEFSKSTL